MEFSLKERIAIVRKRFLFLTVLTMAGLILLYLVTQYVMQPTYTASVKMYVISNDTTYSTDLNELYYAQKVVNTYITFLQTDAFYQRVATVSKLNYTSEQLMKMTAITLVNNTEIFRISVSSHNAEDSYALVTAMQQIAPELIQSIKSSAKISVVDQPTVPKAPSGPNVWLNTAVGGMAGFLLAAGIIFLWEILNTKVKSKEELLTRYHRPILGEIPNYVQSEPRRPRLPSLRRRRNRRPSRTDTRHIEEQSFLIDEAFKGLRINLRYTLYMEGCKKIMVNSALCMDGKSTISVKTAISFVKAGAKVLLMDCDLRKGRLHSFFPLKGGPGMSDYLSGLAKEKDVIQNTNYDNLQIITMGSIPPNPTELLASGRMEELLANQEKNYDYIIIDTPPVTIVADALVIVSLMNGVIIVVRENFTTHPSIAASLSKLEFVGARILGFVYNGFTPEHDKKSASQYYYNHEKVTNPHTNLVPIREGGFKAVATDQKTADRGYGLRGK